MTLRLAGITRAHYSDSWGLCENTGKHSTCEKGLDGNYIVFATMDLCGYWQETKPKNCGRSHSPYILPCSYCGDKKLGKTEPAKASRREAVRGLKSKGPERIPVASPALVYQPNRDSGLSTLPLTALWAEQHPKLLHLAFLNCPILLKCTITCFSQLLGLLRRSK